MEEKKTIFDYLGRVFITFGFSILVLNVFCLLVGEDAREVSSLYSMGSDGLTVASMMQFFGVSICITGLQAVFFTDTVIKQMSVAMRTVCMMSSVIAVIVLCSVAFGWFPVDMWQAWAGFLVSFGICFAGSLGLMVLKERAENRKMEEALRKLKGRE